jgi:hypothetical protein
MKKNISMGLALLILLAAASAAFATPVTFTGSTTFGGLTFNTSNKVTVGVKCDATAGYVAETAHSSGNRVFGTDSAASVIYWKDTTGVSPNVVTTDIAAPAGSGQHGTPDFSNTSNGWTSM